MSKIRENPFPGMNPYMEERWNDVHSTLLVYARRQLQAQLPEDLVAEVEQTLLVGESEGQPDQAAYRPDVSVREPWEESGGVGVAVAEPIQVAKPVVAKVPPRPNRRLGIIDTHGRLITVVEVLSPSNKRGKGGSDYRYTRDDLMESGVNLVEIDLVREGGLLTELFDGDHVTLYLRDRDGNLPPHVVSVFRAARPTERELYPISYQKPLPSFAVPLRTGERDVALDLQSILQQCYEDGAFWMANYRKDPIPKLSPQDANWLDELLKSKGLR